MKKGRKLSRQSKAILKTLLDNGALALDMLLTIPPEFQTKGAYRVGYRQTYNLKRDGYVKKQEKGNVSLFHLTPKGKLAILKHLHLEKLLTTKWDGRWRIVMFDIPEDLKKWRDYIRNELRGLGFHQLQNSVYITPYPVTGELDEMLNEWGLRKYFRYITASEIDGEKELKGMFDLR